MEIKIETTLSDFDAWQGGADRLNVLKNFDLIDEMEELLIEMFEGQAPAESQIDNFFWFDFDDFWCEDYIGQGWNSTSIEEFYTRHPEAERSFSYLQSISPED